MKGRIQAFNNVTFQTLQRPELKMFGKREENGVSNPHVLSMRSYEHIQENYAKRDLLVKSCHVTHWRTYAQQIVKEVKYISIRLNP